MSKVTDEGCLGCCNYDECYGYNSNVCKTYEYYKCIDCINRIIENDEIPRCFIGKGVPCKEM